MGYSPTKKSESEEGEMAPAPESGEINNVLYEDGDRKYCLIEWDKEEMECWIIAGDGDSFKDLDSAL